MLCAGMTLPPLDCEILYMLLDISKHTPTHTPGRETWEVGEGKGKGFWAAVTPVPTLHVHYGIV